VQFRRTFRVGRSHDFRDTYLDIAAREASARTGRGNLSERHFFAEADCSIFTSKARCDQARTHVTYLMSYPCSGNTWARSVLERTSLIYTGSVFYDRSLLAAGMLGEGSADPGRVFPVKTHWPVLGDHTEGEGVRNLVLVRDPLHAALSLAQYLIAGDSHTREVPETTLREYFDENARMLLGMWRDMAEAVKRLGDDKQVVRFEEVVAHTQHSYTTAILPYIGIDSGHPGVKARLSAAIAETSTAYKTTRRKHTYSFHFTRSDRALVSEVIGKELLEHYGYHA